MHGLESDVFTPLFMKGPLTVSIQICSFSDNILQLPQTAALALEILSVYTLNIRHCHVHNINMVLNSNRPLARSAPWFSGKKRNLQLYLVSANRSKMYLADTTQKKVYTLL